jgi:hypothetical protein
MVDFSQLFGGGNSDMSGLLTPQQQGDINQTTMQGIAAGLLKASGPSPYKPGMTALSGLGDALQSGIAARNTAQTGALNQALVKAKTAEGVKPLLEMYMKYQAANQEPPAYLTNALKLVGGLSGIIPPTPGTGGAGALSSTTKPATTAGPTNGWPGALPGEDVRQTASRATGINQLALVNNDPVATKTVNDWIDQNSPSKEAATQRAEVVKQETEAYGKQYAAVQALGRTSAGLYDLGQQAKALMDRPDFESATGFGADTKLEARRLLAGLGVAKPDAAFSAGTFNKIFSEALQSRIEAAKETSAELGPAGRQYLTQLNIMAKASPNINNTLPENRYLVDQMQREAQRHMGIATAAADYATNSPNQRLDKGWDKKYIELLSKPTYSDAERGNMTSGAQLPGSPAPQPTAPAAGQQPIPGMFSPAGPGAPSGFSPITPGQAPTGAGQVAGPGAPSAAPAQPAAQPRYMQPGVIYHKTMPDGTVSHIKIVDGKLVPVDGKGNPLGR